MAIRLDMSVEKIVKSYTVSYTVPTNNLKVRRGQETVGFEGLGSMKDGVLLNGKVGVVK